MKRSTKSLVLLSLLALSANVHAQLPDEIDYPTYLSKYSQAKSDSDSARMSANQLKSMLQQIAADLEANGSAIVISKSEIDEAVAIISQLSTENMDLDNTIAMLTEENLGLGDELQRLARAISELSSEQREIQDDLVGPQRNAHNLRSALDSVTKNLHQNGDRLQKAQKKLDRNRDKIKNLEGNIKTAIDESDRLNLKLPKIQNNIKQKKEDLDKATSKISQLENQVTKFQAELVSANQEVSAAKAKVDQLESKISKQEAKVAPLVEKKNRLNAQAIKAQSTVSSKKSELNKAKNELSSAKSKLSSLKSEKQQLAAQKNALEEKKTKFEEKLAQVEATLKELMANRDRGNANKIKNLREQRKLLRQKIAEVTPRLNKVEADLNKTSAELAQAKKVIAGGDTKVSNLEQEVAAAELQVKKLLADISAVENEIAQAVPQLARLKDRLASAKTELRSAQSAQASAKSKLDQKQTALAQVKKDIKRIEGDIASLKDQKQKAQERITIIASDLKRMRRELNQEKNDFDANRRVVGTLRNTQNALKSERDSYQRRLSIVEDEIRHLRGELDKVQAQLLTLEDEHKQRDQQYVSNVQTIQSSQDRMQSNSYTISSKQSQIAQNENRIQELESQRSALLEDQLVKEGQFAQADAVASDLESITQETYEEYEDRKELYADYKSEAQKMGASQGQAAGATAGEYAGSADVKEDASLYGSKNGRTLGELRGYLAGLVDGKEQGLEAGYDEGVNSQASYDEGYAKGYEQGLQTAVALAKKENFPQGYAQVKEEKFSTLPTNKVVLENSVNGSLFMEKAFAFASTAAQTLTESFGIETPDYVSTEAFAPVRIKSKVDVEIARVEKEIARHEDNDQVSKAKPQYVYTAPTRIDVDEDFKNCFDVYKGVSDFKEACGDSYESAYKSQFVRDHKDTFFAAYEALFEEASDEAASGDFSGETRKAFDKAYKTAFAEARLEGEGVAYQNGATDGEEAGFDENIAAKRSEQLAKGKSEAANLFASSGVVRLNKYAQTSVKTEDPKGLTQDGKFSVGLGLVNFGKLATNRGAVSAKVIAASSNVSVSNTRANLRVLPASSQIDLSDVIQAKVTNNARPGSEVKMQIELTYPGDALRGSYTEVATFVSNVMVNPEVQVGLEFDDKVKDRKCFLGLFNCKFRSHDVKVKLTGLRDFVPGSYDVAISVLEGGKFINLKKAQTQVAAPGKGVVATGALTYKFKKKTKDDKLKFKVDVSYKGELLQSKVIDVRAK